jgi:multicomponent Na+:H+ antiporter subunit D
MKITLFFCAGNFSETLGLHKVSELNGVGRRMPLTTLAFSVAALGMIGAPWTAGYVSKTWLSNGAGAAGMAWAGWVLTGSAVLNAAYFLPILYRAWLKRPDGAWQGEQIQARGWRETKVLLLLPPLVSAAASVLAAVYSDLAWSPLAWAQFIAAREYLR